MGFSEMLLISLLAFLLFGPKKTSELARQLGQHVAHFKRAAADLQSQVTQSLDLPPDALSSVSVDGLRQTIVGVLAPELTASVIDTAPLDSAKAPAPALPVVSVVSEPVDDKRQIIVGELAPGLTVPRADSTAASENPSSTLAGVLPAQLSENTYA